MLLSALLLKIISNNLYFLDDRLCRKFLTTYLLKSTGTSPKRSKFCSDKVYYSFWHPFWVWNQTGEVFVTWIDGKSTQNNIFYTRKKIWIYENVNLLLISFYRCQFANVVIVVVLIIPLVFYAAPLSLLLFVFVVAAVLLWLLLVFFCFTFIIIVLVFVFFYHFCFSFLIFVVAIGFLS